MRRKFLHRLSTLVLQPAGVTDLTVGLMGNHDPVAVRVKLGPKETSVFTFLKCVWVLKPFHIYYLILFQREPEDWHFTDAKAETAKEGIYGY